MACAGQPGQFTGPAVSAFRVAGWAFDVQRDAKCDRLLHRVVERLGVASRPSSVTTGGRITITDNNEPMSESRRSRFDALAGEIGAGGLAGAATGEPVGVAVGLATPVAMRILTRAFREFRERALGDREAVRVFTAYTVAKARIEERLAAGDIPRSDGFFDAWEGHWSDADELLEAVLLAAQREYQERKVRCYGNLYANIGFEPVIDSVTADSLLREADDLSYTQLQLLALVARKDGIPLPQARAGSNGNVSWLAASTLLALDDLGFARRELILTNRPPGSKQLPTNVGVPADLELQPRGQALYVLMELDQLSSTDELRPLAEALWEHTGSPAPWRADKHDSG
jgi:phage gp46-like protein